MQYYPHPGIAEKNPQKKYLELLSKYTNEGFTNQANSFIRAIAREKHSE